MPTPSGRYCRAVVHCIILHPRGRPELIIRQFANDKQIEIAQMRWDLTDEELEEEEEEETDE
jgi:hypothetical protein